MTCSGSCHEIMSRLGTKLTAAERRIAGLEAENARLRVELTSAQLSAQQRGETVLRQEMELARLRANSFAAAVEALRSEGYRELSPTWEPIEEESHPLLYAARWLSQQASKGAQQREPSPALEDGTQDPASREENEAADAMWERDQKTYENKPRLTKGVRYRVVDRLSRRHLRDIGYEFVATGNESCEDCDGAIGAGWYAGIPGSNGGYRVVRVEPEKCERCRGMGGVLLQVPSAPNGISKMRCPDCKGTGEKQPKEKP